MTTFGRTIALAASLVLLASACGDSADTSTNEQSAGPVELSLTVVDAGVTVDGTELSQGTTEVVETDQLIEVAAGGRGDLSAPGVDFELLSGSAISVTEATGESGGVAFLRVNHVRGHVFVRMTGGRLEHVTEHATATTVESDTEFDVCVAPGALTCLMVMRAGSVDMSNEYGEGVYPAGTATFMKPGDPPSRPICVPVDAAEEWEAAWRQGEDAAALGVVVQEWKDTGAGEPC